MVPNHGYAYISRVQAGGQTVLDYLCAQFTHSGREVWQARLLKGEVELDGQTAQENELLRPGNTLTWHRPPWQEEDVPLHFEVLYQDADLLAVAKPAGLPTMPGGGFLEHTLLHQVRQRWPEASPLHRLGRGTSGLVLFSLNAVAGAALLRDWREHRVRKVYRVLVSGIARENHYDIRTPIGPVTHPKLGQVYAASPAGKPAQSLATVLERRADTTLFEVEIRTGRPHQIRIHLASVGLPLLGDPLYLARGNARPDALPGDLGYLLHAHTLEFVHPVTSEQLKLTAPPPEQLRTEAERYV